MKLNITRWLREKKLLSYLRINKRLSRHMNTKKMDFTRHMLTHENEYRRKTYCIQKRLCELPSTGSSCSKTNNYIFIHKMNAEQQVERIYYK